jgi:hypothetical protein
MGQLTPTSVLVHMGALCGLALAAVGGDGVAVGQAFSGDLVADQGHPPLVLGAKHEALALSVDAVHHGPLAADQSAVGAWGQGHDHERGEGVAGIAQFGLPARDQLALGLVLIRLDPEEVTAWLEGARVPALETKRRLTSPGESEGIAVPKATD